MLGTAGHIDHGKTALVRALSGMDTDRLPDEKKRGITIDLGFAWLEEDSRRLALVDVPGHERFIKNMLAGATGLDAALLVIAADDSVMPQTREHLHILQLLGLSDGVIAITKCDLVDPDWVSLVEEEVRALVRGTFLEAAPIVRTSAATGAGIEALRQALMRLWDCAPARRDTGLFRMAVDRAFSVPGHGAVVTGTVVSGSVSVGDELELWPERLTVRVRSLERHEQGVERIDRGNRAAINLAGIHHNLLRRGQELAAPGYLAASSTLSVEIMATQVAVERKLRHRGRYKLHLGTTEARAVLRLLTDAEQSTGNTSEKVVGQLHLARPVVAVYGEPFVLRAESPPATLGGGWILQPVARRLTRRDRHAIAKLYALGSPEPVDRVSAALSFRGLQRGTERELIRETGLRVGEIAPSLEKLAREGGLVEILLGSKGALRAPADVIEGLEQRVLRVLSKLHEERPRHAAIPRAHLSAAFADLPSEGLLAGVLERLAARGSLILEKGRVARADFSPRLSHSERKLHGELQSLLRAGGLSPPDVAELCARLSAKSLLVLDLLRLLVDEGFAAEVNPGLFLSVDADSELKRKAMDRLRESPGTMADLRDAWGTTRKYAVPYGEYLDRLGITRREGDIRVLVDQAIATAFPSDRR